MRKKRECREDIYNKNRFFCVRLTEKERKMLDEKAKAEGVTAGEYLRKCIENRPVNYAAYRRTDNLLEEIRRIGNNVNQIARNANCGYYSKEASERMSKYMKELEDCVKESQAELEKVCGME